MDELLEMCKNQQKEIADLKKTIENLLEVCHFKNDVIAKITKRMCVDCIVKYCRDLEQTTATASAS